MRTSRWMTMARGRTATSPCRGRPCAGRRGGCCASPRRRPAGPTSQLLRLWSFVVERPVAEGVADRVDAPGDVVVEEIRTSPPQSRPSPAGDQVRHRRRPSATQSSDVRSTKHDQPGRPAGAWRRRSRSAGVVLEEPAEVGVEEAVERAVRVALAVGEGVVLEVVGGPVDRPPCIAIEPRIRKTACTDGRVSKLRWVSSRWKPTVTPSAVRT